MQNAFVFAFLRYYIKLRHVCQLIKYYFGKLVASHLDLC